MKETLLSDEDEIETEFDYENKQQQNVLQFENLENETVEEKKERESKKYIEKLRQQSKLVAKR